MRNLLPLLALPAFALACDPAPDSGQPSSEGAGGKADGADAVEVISTDEELFATGLRQQLCGAIGNAHPWSTIAHRNEFVDGCQGHSFTLTEVTKSKLFGHLDDGDPLTLKMRVRVEAGDKTWETSLTRAYDNFQFHWTANVDSLPAGDDRDAFLRDLADDIGEFFGTDDHPENFNMLSDFGQLPEHVALTALDRVEEISEEVDQGNGDESGAGLADTFPHEVIRDGEIVGYTVEVWFFIDHPLFDGGGTTLWFNVFGEIVTEVDWFG